MSSQALVVDGIAYVRSSEAARVVQLTPGYITALARAGLIAGTRVARLWYVNPASLQQFIAEQERQKEIWRAELARQRREEQLAAGHPSLRWYSPVNAHSNGKCDGHAFRLTR